MAEESNSSVAAEVNIRCYRGDTFSRVLRFWSDAEHTVAINIMSDTFKLNVIKKSKATPVLSFTMIDGITLSATNIVALSKTAAQMELLAATYTYDLQQTKADGSVITIQAGEFIIDDDKTI